MGRPGNDAIVMPADKIPPAFLEKLRKAALARGADDAVIIAAGEVIIDPRVRLKCLVPRCYMAGGCAHCPPHGYSIREVREMVAGFGWGIFFRVKMKSTIAAAPGVHRAIETGIADRDGNLLNLGAHHLLVFTLVKVLKKQARERGFVARGFAAGNCRSPLCLLRPDCRKLTAGRCRNPKLSSPSMEACGMDVFRMAARVGWDVFPIGGTCEPESVPRASLMGLVLVGQHVRLGGGSTIWCRA